MKLIKTEDAVGHVICHDMTQIIKGVTKDAVFRKGHIITADDIPVLLSIGKDHLYVWEKQPGMLHEDEAAELLSELCCGEYMEKSPVKEGKIELTAAIDGLFGIDQNRLKQINMLGEIMIAARHNYFPVKKGDKLLGTRVIPLVIAAQKLAAAKALAGPEPLAALYPYKLKTAGIITTGNEVYYGRIEDTFTPVIVDKLKSYGVACAKHIIVSDDQEKITAAIKTVKGQGVDMVLCTGGMSVDPDDRTPLSIRQSGAEIISYGAPVLPGAMFLMGYFADGTPVMGLPGCVMYAKATIFDLVLPRVTAGLRITAEELAGLGAGGLCLGCEVCHFPNCSFGK